MESSFLTWNLRAQQILVDQPSTLLYQNCYCLLDL